jgi:hypothetical protein
LEANINHSSIGFGQRTRAASSKTAIVSLVCLALAGCIGGADIRDAVPEAQVNNAQVVGYGPIRMWGDDASSITEDEIIAVRKQREQAAKSDPRMHPGEVDALTISGGGSSGAFGAGILTGWSHAGTRPQFDIVTGISTGSLIAPFAFLGSDYDGQLTEAFTAVSGKNIYDRNSFLTAISTGALTDNAPLRRLVEKYVNDDMVAAIAREHAKGRRLLIGTTNLDAERPVIWNIGAIAASDAPGKKKLIQDVLVASTSIPGMFPPVDIRTRANGKNYDEMHVDGGTSNQVFLMPPGLSLKAIDRRLGAKIKRRLFIIRNGRTSPEFSVVKRRLLPIAGKSISSLIKAEGVGDLYRMYAAAKRDDVDYNLVDMPEAFKVSEETPFDPKYMNALYRTGYEMARSGVPWEKVPPGFGK